MPQTVTTLTKPRRGTPSRALTSDLLAKTRHNLTSAPAFLRLFIVFFNVVPEETTSSTTTTCYPDTLAKISEICAPSSSLIDRLTAKSKSNCPAIA